MNSTLPSHVVLHRASRQLELEYVDGSRYWLDAEYLRVHSPSAEVRGHGSGEALLVSGKAQVAISSVEPVGNYALRLSFDDGHDSGLYTWDYLADLARDQSANWKAYLQRLDSAGKSRAP